jgi:cytochrome c553
MKYFFPLFCSLVLIGCSDTPSKAPSTSEATVQTSPTAEINQSALPETNTSSSTPTSSIDGSTLFAQKCSACHGSKAEKSALSKSQIIAGWKEDKVKTALKGYQAGTYGKEMKAVMQGQAKGLNDTQIDALAKHISTL